MTLPRLEAVLAHWEKVPPLSHSVNAIATFLGVGKKSSGPSRKPMPAVEREPDPSKVQELFDLLGVNGFGTEKPAWLKAAATT